MNSNAWYDYINQLHYHIKNQDKKIKELENRVKKLEQNSQNNHQTTIEKLEYNFDQLKIERLDGTLHIGLTPDDLSKVEDMSINPSINQPHMQPQNLEQQLVSQLDYYLNQEGEAMLNQLASENNYPLDNSYRKRILADIRKQLPQRVAHYTNLNRDKQSNKNEQELTQDIIENVKKEIYHSLQHFLKNGHVKGDN